MFFGILEFKNLNFLFFGICWDGFFFYRKGVRDGLKVIREVILSELYNSYIENFVNFVERWWYRDFGDVEGKFFVEVFERVRKFVGENYSGERFFFLVVIIL